MLLTVNLGNTNVSCGLFDGGRLAWQDRLPAADLPLLPDRIGARRIDRIAMASVAPSRLEQAVCILATNYSTPVLIAGEDLPYGIVIECDEPGKVGADRVVNAVAAYARIKGAAIVVDIGTAITVDAVSPRGDFLGGAIAPGPDTMLKALHAFTEQLPAVTLERPDHPIGRNTRDAMRSGAYWGAVGAVAELIDRMTEQLGARAPILLTGGGAEPLAPDLCRPVEVLPALTLEGLALLAERTR